MTRLLLGDSTVELSYLARTKALPQTFNLVIFQFLEQGTDLWKDNSRIIHSLGINSARLYRGPLQPQLLTLMNSKCFRRSVTLSRYLLISVKNPEKPWPSLWRPKVLMGSKTNDARLMQTFRGELTLLSCVKKGNGYTVFSQLTSC